MIWVAMIENPNWKRDRGRGVNQAVMRAVIDKNVSILPDKAVHDGMIGQIAVGNQQRGFALKKLGQGRLELMINNVVSGGAAGGRDVQAIFAQSVFGGGQDGRMRSHAEVIAAGKVGEGLAAPLDPGAVNLLEGLHARSPRR